MSKLEIHAIKKVEKNVGASGISVSLLSSMKHWGVVLTIYNVDKERVTQEKLLEAGDSDGQLKANYPKDFEEVEDEWTKAPGFAETDIPVEEPVPYTSDDIKQFIERFNGAKKSYWLLFDNCQEFVRELLIHLKIENVWSQAGIKSYIVKAATWSAASSASVARPAIELIGKEVAKAAAGGDAVAKQALSGHIAFQLIPGLKKGPPPTKCNAHLQKV